MDLFEEELALDPAPLCLPRAALTPIEPVICHRDPERYALLYALIWRIAKGERHLPRLAGDPLVHRLEGMRRAGALRGLVRAGPFHPAGGGALLRRALPRLCLVDPDSARIAPLGPRPPDAWTPCPAGRGAAVRSGRGRLAPYYESVFNPARLNRKAMQAGMPQRYWRNLPEAASIPALVQNAASRVSSMIEQEVQMPARRMPDRALRRLKQQGPRSLEELNAIIARAEPLVPSAPRAVLGEGEPGAPIAFVGEQPGDQEDLQGRPFVGPAGQLLVRAMGEVGLARAQVYLTNAVKHFKFEPKGLRRIHAKPTAGEVKHYRPWLLKELEFVQPKVVVALGATALLALAGKALPVARMRGPVRFEPYAGYVTVHPSYLLRLPDADARRQAYAAFVTDLQQIRNLACGPGELPHPAAAE